VSDKDERTPDERPSGKDENAPATQENAPATEPATQEEAGAQVQPAGRTPLDVVAVRSGMFGVDGSGDTSGYGGLERVETMPGPSPRPYGGYFDEIVDVLAEVLAEAGVDFDTAVEKVVVQHEQLWIYVAREHLPLVAASMRDDPDLRFEFCLGVSGVHYPDDTGRELHAVYPLFSITHNRMVHLEVTAPDADPHIPTIIDTYPANDWHEREAWDFFGVIFDGHPSLARIQMPDDWPGHPQRKDYPLGGIPVEYKGAEVPAPDERRAYN